MGHSLSFAPYPLLLVFFPCFLLGGKNHLAARGQSTRFQSTRCIFERSRSIHVRHAFSSAFKGDGCFETPRFAHWLLQLRSSNNAQVPVPVAAVLGPEAVFLGRGNSCHSRARVYSVYMPGHPFEANGNGKVLWSQIVKGWLLGIQAKIKGGPGRMSGCMPVAAVPRECPASHPLKIIPRTAGSTKTLEVM